MMPGDYNNNPDFEVEAKRLWASAIETWERGDLPVEITAALRAQFIEGMKYAAELCRKPLKKETSYQSQSGEPFYQRIKRAAEKIK